MTSLTVLCPKDSISQPFFPSLDPEIFPTPLYNTPVPSVGEVNVLLRADHSITYYQYLKQTGNPAFTIIYYKEKCLRVRLGVASVYLYKHNI